MKHTEQAWQRLARAARRAADPADTPAPWGFSARVVARWRAGGALPVSPWELALSWRPLACASLVMLLSVAVNFATVRQHLAPDPLLPTELLALLEE